MNGLKYIREKSNISKSDLAGRMGVTRQSVTLWENGKRKPGTKHLEWLSRFYGIDEKWFGDLSEGDMSVLKEMRMYQHFDCDKEYYSFIPEKDGWVEISVTCGDMEPMPDDRYVAVVKEHRLFMKRVEGYLQFESQDKACLDDMIITEERGMSEIGTFLDLMSSVTKVGAEGTYLKVPLRYEIMTAMYAMMIASDQFSTDEVKEKYSSYFNGEGISIDADYMNELADIMNKHWHKVKDEQQKRIPHKIVKSASEL